MVVHCSASSSSSMRFTDPYASSSRRTCHRLAAAVTSANRVRSHGADATGLARERSGVFFGDVRRSLRLLFRPALRLQPVFRAAFRLDDQLLNPIIHILEAERLIDDNALMIHQVNGGPPLNIP